MTSRKVATEKSSIQCGPPPGHQGTVKAVSPGVLTIGGSGTGVLSKADLVAASMSRCQNPQLPTPGKECQHVLSVSVDAVSACLTVNGDGNGVVLETSIGGQTDGAPPGTLPIVDAKQNVLTAQ